MSNHLNTIFICEMLQKCELQLPTYGNCATLYLEHIVNVMANL